MAENSKHHVSEWLKHAAMLLSDAQIQTARLDSLILLEDVLGHNRAWLLAHPDSLISAEAFKELESKLLRRASHEPLAYIRGKAEFYGREFIVTPSTLQPRPETETIIELLLRLDLPEAPHIVDVGTGSGAIAITAKLELPKSQVSATEINADTIKTAEQNSNVFGTNIDFKLGNLLEPSHNSIDVILANLPYVPNGHTINQAAMQEPSIAIFGGEDGLDLYRDMFEQIKLIEQKPKYVITEALPFQHKVLSAVASSAGYKQHQVEDFIQLFVKL